MAATAASSVFEFKEKVTMPRLKSLWLLPMLFIAAVCAAAPKVRPPAVEPACIADSGAPKIMDLPSGKSMFLKLDEPVVRLTVGNPNVIEARLVSSTGLYVLGNRAGSSNLILQDRAGYCTMIDVNVGMDPGGLQAVIARLMPDEKQIQVSSAADNLVLSGRASSALAAERALMLAGAFARSAMGAVSTSGTQPSMPVSANRVVNLLQVEGAQQVMLEVKVAEVSKTLLDQLGVKASSSREGGWGTVSILSDFLSGTAGGNLDIHKRDSWRVLLEAEKRDGLVRILAEPNVMALSGQEGSFLAGGKILIPVAQNNTGTGTTITLEEKEFGVGLKFTPTVLGDGRINLKVSPEVSELSREGVGINATGLISAGAVLPLITTRRASTTVQLRDGQSFAIGGLIKNSASANVKAFPILGELPVLGMLFRSTDFQSEKTELVFVVTPRLVKPLPADYTLPTDAVDEPNRNDIMLKGRIEGSAR